MKNLSLKMIAIVDSEFGIAKDEKIPWSFAEDLKFFYQKTKNNIVIMGRRTFESLGAPLKNRENYVISRTMKNDVEGISVFDSLEHALEHIETQVSEAWLIGGAELFNYALKRHLIDEAFITQVPENFHADIFLDKSLLDYLKREIIKQDKDYKIYRYSL